MRVAFIKCHGSGNDFPLIDARALALDEAAWPGIARALADRAGPVGGDGLLALLPGGESGDFRMRMWNPDGSEAETCLNGLRCVARAGMAALGQAAAAVALHSSTATVAEAPPLAPGVATIRETVGPALLDSSPWLHAGQGSAPLIEAPLPMLGEGHVFTALAMPNPHLIAFVAAVDEAALVALGDRCEAAPAWLPQRANLSFVEQRGGDLFVRTYERGVGLTNSCGSAMAAASVVACLTGRLGYDTAFTVFNAGGLVRACVTPDLRVTLLGNATFEWAGSVDVDAAAGRARDLVVEQRFEAEIAAWAALVAGLGR